MTQEDPSPPPPPPTAMPPPTAFPLAAAAAAAPAPAAAAAADPSLPPAPRPRHLPDGISVGGWRITTRRRPIAGDAQLTAIAAALGLNGGGGGGGGGASPADATTAGEAAAAASSPPKATTTTTALPISLPEILFADSVLLLEHEPSGARLSFAALDALREWRREDLPPAQVGAADAWQRARREEIARQGAVVLSYDWTFTTPYRGSTVVPSAGGAAAAAAAGIGGEATEAAATAAAAAAAATTNPTPTCWRPSATRTIDRALLSSRADPILYYADVPLYESELDDNGAVSLSAKIRVMPRCWLVLLRLFVRVDGRLARLRETRAYCRFDQAEGGVVVRETRHHEGDAEALRAAGVAATVAGGAGGAFADGDSAAAAFGAIAPVCMKLFETEELVLG